MIWIAYLLCATAGDPARAGAAMERGREELRLGRPDAACRSFQEALSHEPEETPRLLYRDARGRHEVPYHPHYEWAKARAAQAESAAADVDRARHLQEAVAHFELSRHPAAAAEAGQARRRLSALAPGDPGAAAVARLRRAVDERCAESRYEDALAALAAENDLLGPRPELRAELFGAVRARREEAVEGRRRLLALSLENLAGGDWTRRPEGIPALLAPAQVPPPVQREPEPAFRWLASFIALVESEAPVLREAARRPVADVLRSAEAFEASAEAALAAQSFPGFRAARSAAHALRSARLTASEDGGAALIEAGGKAAARAESLVRARSDGKAYVEGELAAQRRRIEELGREAGGRARETASVREVCREAEQALSKPGLMANPEALRLQAEALGELDRASRLASLPAPDRARALLCRAALDVTAALLEGGEGQAPADEVRRALALDARSLDAFKPLVPPKVSAILSRAAASDR